MLFEEGKMVRDCSSKRRDNFQNKRGSDLLGFAVGLYVGLLVGCGATALIEKGDAWLEEIIIETTSMQQDARLRVLTWSGCRSCSFALSFSVICTLSFSTLVMMVHCSALALAIALAVTSLALGRFCSLAVALAVVTSLALDRFSSLTFAPLTAPGEVIATWIRTENVEHDGTRK
jgi:hypothetical protein